MWPLCPSRQFRGVGLTPRDALTWCVAELPSVHLTCSWPPARKAPFHIKIPDEMASPLSNSSYATKFHHQDSPGLLPFPLIGVVRLKIRTVTKFCSPFVNAFHLEASGKSPHCKMDQVERFSNGTLSVLRVS